MVETIGRIFLAVPLPVEARMAIADQISELAIPGRRTAPEDWHITLRFLGDVDQVTCERFLYGLTAVGEVASFPMALEGVGAFPKASKATVVWVGIGSGMEGLRELNEVGEAAAVGAGLSPEDRPFRPHLTLSRVRPPQDVSDLVGGDVAVGWRCDRVIVYRTRTGGDGLRYQPVETIQLAG